MKFIIFLAAFLCATQTSAQGVYEGQIDGTFNGWTGDSVYKLVDGHIIQQSSYHYHYHYAYRPKVIIYQTSFGLKIKVDNDSDEDVAIKIIK